MLRLIGWHRGVWNTNHTDLNIMMFTLLPDLVPQGKHAVYIIQNQIAFIDFTSTAVCPLPFNWFNTTPCSPQKKGTKYASYMRFTPEPWMLFARVPTEGDALHLQTPSPSLLLPNLNLNQEPRAGMLVAPPLWRARKLALHHALTQSHTPASTERQA